jgi:hypothetical protein
LSGKAEDLIAIAALGEHVAKVNVVREYLRLTLQALQHGGTSDVETSGQPLF